MQIWKLSILAVVAGCTSPNSGSGGPAPGSPEWFQTASDRDMATYFRGICVSSGVLPGTREMADCIQREASSSGQADVARSAALAASTGGN